MACIKKIFKIRRAMKEWRDENRPVAKELGYPDCCIHAFCEMPPLLIRYLSYKRIQIPNYEMRYRAGCIDGKFTGFIPCAKHAQQILENKITLESLIKNRSPLFPPFPYWGHYES